MLTNHAETAPGDHPTLRRLLDALFIVFIGATWFTLGYLGSEGDFLVSGVLGLGAASVAGGYLAVDRSRRGVTW